MRLWITAGLLLLLLAAVNSPGNIETALGRTPGSLAWGPVLFRLLLAVHGFAAIVIGFLTAARQKQDRSPAPHVRDRRAWLGLGLLLAAALALRLYKLDNGLWLDEILMLLDFVRAPLGTVVSSFPFKNQHMLYSVLASLSVRGLGESAWSLRLPAVLFGGASIWALFLLGKRLAGTRVALLACALMTFSYHHVWFSQNARGYTGLLFFTILATWLWLEASDRQSWRWWLWYSTAVALGFWVQMAVAVVAAAHLLVWIWMSFRTRGWARWQPGVALALAATLTLQLHALALPELLGSALREVSPESEWTSPLWMVREIFRSAGAGIVGLAAVLGGGLTALVGAWRIWRRDRMATMLMVLPALTGTAMILGSGHNLWPRFYFFEAGFALLFVVEGAAHLPHLIVPRERAAARAGTALACLVIGVSAATLPRAYALPKQDYAGARDFVERQKAAGDSILVAGLAGRMYTEYYAPEWKLVRTKAELDAHRPAAGQTWLVYTLPVELRANYPGLWKAIEADFQVVRVFPGTLGGGELYVCRDKSRNLGGGLPE